MKKLRTPGFLRLAQKSFAILTSSLAALLGASDAKAVVSRPTQPDLGFTPTYGHFQNKFLKAKLVLKFNPANPEESLLMMHASHRSHSSHSSHASSSHPSGHYSHSSHTSHTSHYSSSPTFTPSSPAAVPTSPSPSQSTPSSPSKSSHDLPEMTLGYRILMLECEGTDVLWLQNRLVELGYTLDPNGYFGIATEDAVKAFQKKQFLRPDGKVGPITLSKLQSK